MRIDQVVVGASPGDAITTVALDLRTRLRQAGPSDVYARHVDPRLAGEVLPFDALAGPDRAVLVYHASIGEPEVARTLAERAEPLALVYHNVSPAAAFEPYDPAFARLLASGRDEVRALHPRTVLAVAVSHYNAEELAGLGYRDVAVLPLVPDPRRLLAVEPHADTSEHLRRNVVGRVALFVGQLLPHKRPEVLVQAYHALVTYLEPDAHLVVVGAGRLPRYRDAVHAFVHELNLPRVWLAGSVGDDVLASFYRRADLFVTASAHEGFCVPLLEAMAFEVPVVARGCAAVPETVGDAGLVLPCDSSPLLLAEAMAEVASDQGLRRSLAARGTARVAAVDTGAALDAMARALMEAA